MMRRNVIDKVRKFEDKIQRINEDKDKTGQEKINTIMEKYYKTQETLVCFSIFAIHENKSY